MRKQIPPRVHNAHFIPLADVFRIYKELYPDHHHAHGGSRVTMADFIQMLVEESPKFRDELAAMVAESARGE